MKKMIKRALASVLVLCLSVVPFCSVSAAAAATPQEEIMPLYNNVSNVTANLGISDSGKMTINYSYVGSSGITTKAVITTYQNLRKPHAQTLRVQISFVCYNS